MLHFNSKFHMPSSDSSLVIAIKLEASENVHKAVMLYILCLTLYLMGYGMATLKVKKCLHSTQGADAD
jgi:hypothetical protein